jgi:hypothetical protein
MINGLGEDPSVACSTILKFYMYSQVKKRIWLDGNDLQESLWLPPLHIQWLVQGHAGHP